MNTRFTIEEENIVAIYAEDSRETTLENILAAMPYMDEDMRQLAAAAVNTCWGTPSSRYLADAAACAVVFSCRSSVAAPFCRAAPCCLAACSFIDPDPWPAGGVADGSAVFPPVGGGRCPASGCPVVIRAAERIKHDFLEFR